MTAAKDASNKDTLESLKERLASVPAQPGVYIYRDKDGRVIYVGKAKNLRNRMRSYFQAEEGLLPKVRLMVSRMRDFEYIVTSSEVEALILENNLIKQYQPRYNIMMRDDKSYPYLKVTIKDEYPRFYVVREKKDGRSKYYGPYVDAGGLKEAAKGIREVFPLRSCRNMPGNKRPCLNYHIHRCAAPCAGKITREEYSVMVEELLSFLDGDYSSLLELKQAEMTAAAKAREYERAARLRDQIEGMRSLATRQFIVFEQSYNLDAFALAGTGAENLAFLLKIRDGKVVAQESFWLKRSMDESDEYLMAFVLRDYYDQPEGWPQEILVSHVPEDRKLLEAWMKDTSGRAVHIQTPSRGDKRKILDTAVRSARAIWEEKTREDLASREILNQLAQTLQLEVIPERIECFDISHLSGTDTVASMAVFSCARPDRKAYRRFKMLKEQNDDFASLQEAIGRRFAEAEKGNKSFLPLPDLLLVDGGYGQVNAVARQLREMNISVPLVSIAKKQEELFLPGNPLPIVLDRRDDALKLLQRVRDEAHRFAVEYNRLRRQKRNTKSELDDIPGIGPKRRQMLLTHFGSVKNMRAAELGDIEAAPGMNHALAAILYDRLHRK